jgi:hypothetical protein
VFTSPDAFSTFTASFMNNYTDISLGIGMKLIHYSVIGVILVGTGASILLLRREKIAVTEGVIVVLECPFCKSRWQESMSKSHLEAMDYPEVRSLSRRKCAKCAKFMRPKIIETHKV